MGAKGSLQDVHRVQEEGGNQHPRRDSSVEAQRSNHIDREWLRHHEREGANETREVGDDSQVYSHRGRGA